MAVKLVDCAAPPVVAEQNMTAENKTETVRREQEAADEHGIKTTKA